MIPLLVVRFHYPLPFTTIMNTASYYSALNKATELAPSIDRPTEFIRWAEDICELLSYIYSTDYEQTTEDLVEKVKEAQDAE